MAKVYTTISGDTWDMVAYRAYGKELFADKIMEANRDKLEYMIFPDGIQLVIPDQDSLETRTVSSDAPEWRKALNG